jgi:hypothetical protein
MEASLFIFNLHYIRFLDISDAIEKISLESLTGYQDAWFLSSIFSSYMDKPIYCFNIPHSSLYIRWNKDFFFNIEKKTYVALQKVLLSCTLIALYKIYKIFYFSFFFNYYYYNVYSFFHLFIYLSFFLFLVLSSS